MGMQEVEDLEIIKLLVEPMVQFEDGNSKQQGELLVLMEHDNSRQMGKLMELMEHDNSIQMGKPMVQMELMVLVQEFLHDKYQLKGYQMEQVM